MHWLRILALAAALVAGAPPISAGLEAGDILVVASDTTRSDLRRVERSGSLIVLSAGNGRVVRVFHLDLDLETEEMREGVHCEDATRSFAGLELIGDKLYLASVSGRDGRGDLMDLTTGEISPDRPEPPLGLGANVLPRAHNIETTPDGDLLVASKISPEEPDEDTDAFTTPRRRIQRLDFDDGRAKLIFEDNQLRSVLAILPNGDFLMAGSGAIRVLDRDGRHERMALDKSLVDSAMSILVDRDGALLVSGSRTEGLIRVNLDDRELDLVSFGRELSWAQQMVFDNGCRVVVREFRGVARVDPRTGDSLLLTERTRFRLGSPVAVVPDRGSGPARCRLPQVAGLPGLRTLTQGTLKHRVDGLTVSSEPIEIEATFHSDGTFSAADGGDISWSGKYTKRNRRDGRRFSLEVDEMPGADIQDKASSHLSFMRIKANLPGPPHPSPAQARVCCGSAPAEIWRSSPEPHNEAGRSGSTTCAHIARRGILTQHEASWAALGPEVFARATLLNRVMARGMQRSPEILSPEDD